jgi:hypothetical protein
MLRDAEDGYPWPPRRDWYPAELALAAGENDRRSLVEAIYVRRFLIDGGALGWPNGLELSPQRLLELSHAKIPTSLAGPDRSPTPSYNLTHKAIAIGHHPEVILE